LAQGPGAASLVSVLAKAPKQSGRIYVESAASVRVGMAFSNPNPVDATLSFFFTDESGRDFGMGSTVIPANGPIARFVTEEPFNGPTQLQGTLTYNASVPLAVLAVRGFVNEEGDFVMPQIPTADFGARATTIVPQFTDGVFSSQPAILAG